MYTHIYIERYRYNFVPLVVFIVNPGYAATGRLHSHQPYESTYLEFVGIYEGKSWGVQISCGGRMAYSGPWKDILWIYDENKHGEWIH